MFVQPVGVKTFTNPNILKAKKPSFKAIDLSPYQNYEGGSIPEIEAEKYCKTLRAKALEEMGKFTEAAEEWFSIARICRSQGKERDAFLCDTSAHKLLRGMHI
jgi:hypothetical protein